jgi:hypothetical protein
VLIDEKSTSHLMIKSQAKIDEEKYQKFLADTIINQVCSFKTLHGLQPFVRYDAKHHRSTSIVDVFKASKEKSLWLMESEKNDKNYQKQKIDHLKIILATVKEGGWPIANN